VGNDRIQQILQMLEHKGEIHLQQLKTLFPEVSLMTLRRDLITLEQQGYLIRTHGGAVSIKRINNTPLKGEEDAYSRRASENIEAKVKIAEKAITLVEKGRSIYFDAGSTVMCLAEILPDENYSILTSGLNIALELVKKSQPSVVSIGGLVNRNTLSGSGPNALSMLDTINIDLAFMAASGFSIDSGFTVSNIYECELKRKIIQRAQQVIVLMDTSKLNKNQPFTFGKLADIDIWICENQLPMEYAQSALEHDVKVIL
jgi:DeoR/GlpR family transcriptional regulator of sugar metabolism